MTVTKVRPDDRQFWIETIDGSGNRTGIISNINNAQITRVLDGIGSIAFDIPGTDYDAVTLAQPNTKVRMYIFERDAKRLLGSGVITKRRASDRSSNFSITCTGPDELDDLDRHSLLVKREYNDESISDIVNGTMSIVGLLDFVSGWTATVTATGNQYARFDGLSVLKALKELVESKGTHFRLGTSAQTIEVGDFGTSNGLTLMQAMHYTPEMDSNDDIGIIEGITITEDADKTVDFIVALGATTGADIALTLEDSDRSISGGYTYDVQTDTYDGRTYHYIGTSTKTIAQVLADNSLILKLLSFDQIQIQSNSDADILTASNALYDVAAAYLDRHKDTFNEYSVSVKKLRSNVRPGDKIRMQYKGWIEDIDGNLLPPQNINSDFWVMQVTESITLDGVTTSMTLANIDRQKMDAAKIIVGEIERAKVRNLSVKPYTTTLTYPYQREIDSSHNAIVPVNISNRVLRVREVLLKIKSTPFRTLASGASSGGGTTETSVAGGDHHHELGAISPSSTASSGTRRLVSLFDNTGTIMNAIMEDFIGMAGKTWRTQSSSGDHSHDITITPHTHTLTYAINDDTAYPADITVDVNGTDRTVALGGPWGTSGSGVDLTLDITEYITGEVTLRKIHDVTIGCGSSQGRIEATVEAYVDVQNVDVA